MAAHPELRDLLADLVQNILHQKPADVYAFVREYFA